MKNALRLILFFWGSLFSCTLYAYYFKHIGAENGLSQLSVVSMHQDALGRIWLGTTEGLNIYDGREIVTLKGGDYRFDTFIKRNIISNIVEDTQHDIWFTADDALIKYELKTGKISCVKEDGVTSVSSVDGHIYVSVSDSILFWDKERDKLRLFTKTGLPQNTINSIYKDSRSTWWLVTDRGLYKKEDISWICVIPHVDSKDIFESQSKELWIATNTGLYKIGEDGHLTRFVHNSAEPNSISCDRTRCILEDKAGNLWIGTFKGLNKYSPEENKFEVFVEDNFPGSLKHSSVHSLLKDIRGNIWVGTFYGGASVFTPEHEFFRYYPVDFNGEGRLSFSLVGKIVEDKRHDLWICTDGGGLNYMNRSTQQFRTFNKSQYPIKSDNLKSICYDSIHDKIYFSMFLNGLECYDIKKEKFENCLPEKVDGYSHRNVVRIAMYRNCIMFLSGSGLFLLSPESGLVKPLFIKKGCSEFLVSSGGDVYVLHESELICINLNDTTKVKTLDLRSVGSNYYEPLCLCEASDGIIYIGTQGAGILEYNSVTGILSRYTAKQHKLLSDYCYAMVNSKQRMLILLGDKGFSFFNTQTKKVEYCIMKEKLPVTAFNYGNTLLVAENGDIFAGSTNGLFMISEKEICQSDENKFLYFSSFYVNNRKVIPNDGTGILDKTINFVDQIALEHDWNNLIFTFADNNFGNVSISTSYEYMLEGFDTEWISDNGDKRILYTNLNPGEYVLRVREADRYGNTSSREIRLNIFIRQPFYNTFLAWSIYVILITAVLSLVWFGHRRRLELKKSLDHERIEKKNMEELNRLKFDFFTNISHELRTPLTLIITQTEMLLNNNGLANIVRNKVSKLYRNAFYMHDLINELLDFHKLEQKQMRLKICHCDIIPFLNEIYLMFKEKAIAQGVTYKFVIPESGIFLWFDVMQLRKVFFNLLSNAFKYTGRGGIVEMVVTEEEDECVIRIIDTGIGIAKEETQKIFERFYQTTVSKDIIGSGIGLALSKEIVELHHGEIMVESMPGYGSVFIVRLKKMEECLQNDPQIEFSGTLETFKTEIEIKEEEFDARMEFYSDKEEVANIPPELLEESERQSEYTILIVEDDRELLTVLDELFSGLYRVLKAGNGEEGWNIVQKEQPDIVLSDVMMPEMDGLEMCAKIKNNIKTCHIPVILLTAASTSKQQMEGLRTGADDYLAKPFNMKVLLLKVSSILRSRNLLKGFLNIESKANFELLAKNGQEQRMLRKIENIVETNLADSNFDVGKLAEELGMSRSSTFKKMKALIGISPSEFILGYRLKKATTLLLDYPEFQMEEIALTLGFSSGRYFSKCFKEYFNMTPLQYRKLNKLNN